MKRTLGYNRTRNSAGQSLVEFALAIPFLLVCLIGIIYFGKLFYIKQVIAYAAQEGARAASRLPDLSNSATVDRVRGFSEDGSVTGPDDDSNPSPVYRALAAARLLSGPQGIQGSLPAGARVLVEGALQNSDRVTVTVEYPFGLFFHSQTGNNSGGEVTAVNIAMSAEPEAEPVRFGDFLLRESASAAQEVYQQ
ncbi:MAG: pilus assembly protein [Candidatus Obscuribacterales bacterium]|nr:pilus assembly protein [Candidatus Obscuribacterales bacterium]